MPRSGIRASSYASLVAVAAILLAPRTARADVRVERSEGADSCPDSASFAARIRVNESRSDESLARSTVHFERTPKGYRSSVVTSDGMRRSLADDAASCDGIAEATLAVKLALDLSVAPAPAPAPEPEPALARETPEP